MWEEINVTAYVHRASDLACSWRQGNVEYQISIHTPPLPQRTEYPWIFSSFCPPPTGETIFLRRITIYLQTQNGIQEGKRDRIVSIIVISMLQETVHCTWINLGFTACGAAEILQKYSTMSCKRISPRCEQDWDSRHLLLEILSRVQQHAYELY